MPRLKHVSSPQGGGRPDKAALLYPALAHLDLLAQVSQWLSVAESIRVVAESVCCEGLGLADQEVAVLLDGRVRFRAERRRE